MGILREEIFPFSCVCLLVGVLSQDGQIEMQRCG